MEIFCIYYDDGCDSSDTRPYDNKSYFLTLLSAQNRLREIVEKELTYLFIVDDNRAERRRQSLFIEEVVVKP
jgi:hypothetical protein